MALFDVVEIDRATWGDGPWHDEPDLLEWPDPETGLACMAKRQAQGFWCGYVGIPLGHPAAGKEDDYAFYPYKVHGGVTYCTPVDSRFWIGFDCMHGPDFVPGGPLQDPFESLVCTLSDMFDPNEYEDHGDGRHYWTLAEVKAEVESLAHQIAATNGVTHETA